MLDLLTASDPVSEDLVNNGVVILNTERPILSSAKIGNDFTCTAHGYEGHSYQLQRADSPGGPWTDIGPAKPGAGTTLTFIDTGGATATRRFYRLSLQP